MRKTLSNIIFNGLYQLLIIAIPIITVPYVARVLGAEMLGINSYILSICSFLSIIMNVGMTQLGTREIAQVSLDLLTIKFRQLWSIQVIVGLLTIVIYLLCVWTFLPFKYYFLLELPFLVGYLLDVSWFFLGIGEVKKVIIRNSVIKLASLSFVFIFVHDKNDLWIYVLINSLGVLLANMTFWIPMIKEFKVFNGFNFDVFRKINIKIFKTAIVLAIPQIAVQFYTSFDSTIVGSISGPTQLSYYDQSQKIARIVLAVITSVSTIIMPKLAEFNINKSSENEKKATKLFKTSLDYTLVISLLFSIILMTNSRVFVPWFFSENFSPMIKNMFWVSLIIPFISYGGAFANQYALSKGLYREYSIPFYIGAVISLSLNFVLVPVFHSFGGTITIIITEFAVCSLRVLLLRRYIKNSSLFSEHFKYVICAIITLLLTTGVERLHLVSLPFFEIFILTIFSIIIYIIILIVFRTRFLKDIKFLLYRLR